MHALKPLPWFAATLFACAGHTFAASSTAADEAAIRAQSVSWAKAYNGGDAVGVAAQYADDALLMPPGAPGVRGRAAIQAYFTKDIAASHAAGVVFNLDPHTDVGVAGDTDVGVRIEVGNRVPIPRRSRAPWSSPASSCPSRASRAASGTTCAIPGTSTRPRNRAPLTRVYGVPTRVDQSLMQQKSSGNTLWFRLTTAVKGALRSSRRSSLIQMGCGRIAPACHVPSDRLR